MPLKEILGIGKLAEAGHKAFQMNKARRKAKMVNKIVSKVLASMGMQKISKMVAVPVGAAVGFLVTKLPFLAPLITEEYVLAVSVSIATLIVGAFPANEPTKKQIAAGAKAAKPD